MDSLYGAGSLGYSVLSNYQLGAQTNSTCHPVKIMKVNGGFIVHVGCQTFVEKDWKELSSKIEEYWNNPIEVEKKYCNKV